MILGKNRSEFIKEVFGQIVYLKNGIPNFADKDSKSSSEIACRVMEITGFRPNRNEVSEQRVGKIFGELVCAFLNNCFAKLGHLRPGEWQFSTSQDSRGITKFEQYSHLAILENELTKNRDLRSILGGTYLVKPDIVIARQPLADEDINQKQNLLSSGKSVAGLTPLRKSNSESPILHACISCKWTIRSDRSQNIRTEALNLLRFRKGNTPHIAAVIAEPLPTRIASVALGTGDIDCVYHIMLPELKKAIQELKKEDQLDMLETMIQGNRLRDISDLVFDLAI